MAVVWPGALHIDTVSTIRSSGHSKSFQFRIRPAGQPASVLQAHDVRLTPEMFVQGADVVEASHAEKALVNPPVTLRFAELSVDVRLWMGRGGVRLC